jgi:hypothetical protein
MKQDIEETETGHGACQTGGHRDQEVSRVGQADLEVLGEIVGQNGEVSHLVVPDWADLMSFQTEAAAAAAP